MKKLIAIAILCVMLVTSAYALELDLSELSVEELLALQNDVQVELQSKLSAFPSGFIDRGSYEVGVVLQAGTYTFTATYSNKDGGYVYVDVYASVSALDSSYSRVMVVGDTITISLESGMVLALAHGGGILVSAAKPTWAP